jgi:hypothetical protein
MTRHFYYPADFAKVLDDLTETSKSHRVRPLPALNRDSIVRDGTTSVTLDTETLKNAAGLTVTDVKGSAQPAEGFAVGFDIERKSTFRFGESNGFTPKSGTIEHSGTVSLQNDILGNVTVGDFSIGYDANRKTDKTSGFFVRDTVDTDAVLFDVSNPSSLSTEGDTFKVGKADLLVSGEFSQLLNSKGVTSANLTGADVGDVSIDAITRSIPSFLGDRFLSNQSSSFRDLADSVFLPEG